MNLDKVLMTKCLNECSKKEVFWLVLHLGNFDIIGT